MPLGGHFYTAANISRYCEWIGITRQAYYQSEKRAQIKAQETQQVLELVMEYRYLMPSIGTRKLYWLIKPKLLEQGLKFGRDQLFKVLKENDLLIRPKRRYTKTTDSKHWMKKHPNLLKELDHLISKSIVIYNCYRPHLSLNMITPNQMYEKAKTELIA
nr:hypothetical protein [Acinetobacter haemolyticus]